MPGIANLNNIFYGTRSAQEPEQKYYRAGSDFPCHLVDEQKEALQQPKLRVTTRELILAVTENNKSTLVADPSPVPLDKQQLHHAATDKGTFIRQVILSAQGVDVATLGLHELNARITQEDVDAFIQNISDCITQSAPHWESFIGNYESSVQGVAARLGEDKWDATLRDQVIKLFNEFVRPAVEVHKEDIGKYVVTRESFYDHIENHTSTNTGLIDARQLVRLLIAEAQQQNASQPKPEEVERVLDLLRQNRDPELSKRLGEVKWDASLREQVFPLFDAVYSDRKVQHKSNGWPVTGDNLPEHIEKHTSSKTGLIDRTQFLQLLYAEARQQNVGQVARDEAQAGLTLLQEIVKLQPDECQQCWQGYNSMAHLEPSRAVRPSGEQGRAFSRMTIFQKAVWCHNAFNAASAIYQRPDSTPAVKLTAEKPSVAKAEQPQAKTQASFVNQQFIKMFIGGVIGAVADKERGVLAGIMAALIPQADTLHINLPARLQPKNKFLDFDRNVSLDVSLPVDDFQDNVLEKMYRDAGMKGDTLSRVKNDKIKVTVFDDYKKKPFLDNPGGMKNLNTVKYSTDFYFTPREIARGDMTNKLWDHAGALKTLAKFGYDIHWPSDYPDELRASLQSGFFNRYLDYRIGSFYDSPANTEMQKDMIRTLAHSNLALHKSLITNRNHGIHHIAEKDLENAQQVIFKDQVIPNLFIVNDHIFSLNIEFTPINFSDVKNNIAQQVALQQEILAGLPKKIAEQGENLFKDSIATRGRVGGIPGFAYIEHPTLKAGTTGNVDKILSASMVSKFKEDIDYTTLSDLEMGVRSGATLIELGFRFMPIWGPIAKLSLGTNFVLGLLSTTPALLKYAVEDNPAKARKHFTAFLFSLGVQLSGGVLAKTNINWLNRLADKTTAQLIAKLDSKEAILGKYFAIILRTVKNSSVDIGTSFLQSVPPGQRLLMARMMGTGIKELEKTLDKHQSEFKLHKVQTGDTLSDISRKYYGNDAWYMEIYNANRFQLSNPDLLPGGVTLTIPDLPDSTQPADSEESLNQRRYFEKLGEDIRQLMSQPQANSRDLIEKIGKALSKNGVKNIKYRGMYIWNEIGKNPEVHYALTGELNGKKRIFDPEGGKLFSKPGQSYILSPEDWTKKYQGLENAKRIIYRDYSFLNMATYYFMSSFQPTPDLLNKAHEIVLSNN